MRDSAQEILEAWAAGRQIALLAARRLVSTSTLPLGDRRAATQPRGARRAAGRAQDRLHQPDDLGGIRGFRADLGRHVCNHAAGDGWRGDLGPVADLEPRIEPEIAFGLARAPEPGMDEAALLRCIGWVAHGFEIVQSMFPGWRFAAADTVAAFGLHGAYRIGPRIPVADAPVGSWLAALGAFEISLHRNDAKVDRGQARNVLDGPLSALRHLNDLLAADRHNPPLAAGEIVTTGTVTRAFRLLRAKHGGRNCTASRCRP